MIERRGTREQKIEKNKTNGKDEDEGEGEDRNRFDEFFSNPKSTLEWIVFLANHQDHSDQLDSKKTNSFKLKPNRIIDLNHLQQAAHFLSPIEYKHEVLIERNLNDRCGFPICHNKPIDQFSRNKLERKSKTTRMRMRMRMRKTNEDIGMIFSSFNNNAIPTHAMTPNSAMSDREIDDDDDQPKFCSQICRDRSDEYLRLIQSIKARHPFRSQSYYHPEPRSTSPILTLISSDKEQRQPTSSNDHQEFKDLLLPSSLILEEDEKLEEQILQPTTDSSSPNPFPFSSQPLPPSLSSNLQNFNFLEPILNQFQSLNLKNQLQNDKRNKMLIDQNLNRAFSSIKIIEHPPSISSTSTPSSPSSSSSSSSSSSQSSLSLPPPPLPLPPDPSKDFDEPDHRFLNLSIPQISITKPSATTTTNTTHSIDELTSVSLTRTLTNQTILLNSIPGSFKRRRHQLHKLSDSSKLQEPNPTNTDTSHIPSSESNSITPNGFGNLQAEIIYNVASIEDQLEIDRAMNLRDQLYPSEI